MSNPKIKPIKLGIGPGHGMGNRAKDRVSLMRFDPGAINPVNNTREADIVLAWANELTETLNRMSIETWMARSDNSTPAPLNDVYERGQLIHAGRVRRALAAGCTHYLDLHCDGSLNMTVRGTETIYRTEEDKRFAQVVLDCAAQATGLKMRGVKTEASTHVGRLAVLDFPGPATLLELGFVTNVEDVAVMQQEARMRRFAELLGQRLGGNLNKSSTPPQPAKAATHYLPEGARMYSNATELHVAGSVFKTPHGVFVHEVGNKMFVRPVQVEEVVKKS